MTERIKESSKEEGKLAKERVRRKKKGKTERLKRKTKYEKTKK